jgi:hypothetical protein
MCNDSTYWLAFSLLIVGASSFVLGRFYERADRWLRDHFAERRAVKAALASRAALGEQPHREPGVRKRLAVIGRRLAIEGAEAPLWR